jgi:DNA-binding protein H-NS
MGDHLLRRIVMARVNVQRLSFEELLELKEQVDRAVERQAAKQRSDLEQRLAKLSSVMGKPARAASANGKSPLAGRRAEPKYRNPNDRSQTWAGRGLQPRWMRELVAQGHDPEEFAIGAQSAARRSKAVRKK